MTRMGKVDTSYLMMIENELLQIMQVNYSFQNFNGAATEICKWIISRHT